MVDAQVDAVGVALLQPAEQLAVGHIHRNDEPGFKVLSGQLRKHIVVLFGDLVGAFHAGTLAHSAQGAAQGKGTADGVTVRVLVGEEQDVLLGCQHRGGGGRVDHTAHASPSSSADASSR